MYDPYSEFTKSVLPNRLEVHSVFWNRPWVKVEVIVHSGGREDPVEMPGLAHFVEHVVSENISGWKYDQVREFFETCGGSVNLGITSYEATRYKFTVPADLEIFRQALAIFGSMLLRVRIEQEVERERQVILREFNGNYPFLEKLEWDINIRRSLFKGHRLETWNRPLGRPQGFLSTTETDLQGFYDKHYVPANMSMVIIGGLGTEEVLGELQKSPLGAKKEGARNPIPQPIKQIPTPTERSRTVKLSDHVNFKVDQAEYRAIWAFPANFPEQSRRVFDRMLGKILFEEIREKRGLAYRIGTVYQDFQDVCEYEIRGNVGPDAVPYIDELVQECISIVYSKRALFDRQLKSCIQRCLMVDLSGSTLAEYSADDLISNHRILPMKEIWDELQKVTFDQMIEASSLLNSERQYTFITTP